MGNLLRSTAIVVAGLLIAVMLVSGTARQADSASIKELMGDNFQNIQVILYNLVSSNYQAMSSQITTIRDHARELTKNMPESVASDFKRKMFENYAYQLESTTGNMLTVLEELIRHDRAAGMHRGMPAQAGQLPVDYLRVVVARQFGDIVTSCVLCHNQFRRHALN